MAAIVLNSYVLWAQGALAPVDVFPGDPPGEFSIWHEIHSNGFVLSNAGDPLYQFFHWTWNNWATYYDGPYTLAVNPNYLNDTTTLRVVSESGAAFGVQSVDLDHLNSILGVQGGQFQGWTASGNFVTQNFSLDNHFGLQTFLLDGRFSNLVAFQIFTPATPTEFGVDVSNAFVFENLSLLTTPTASPLTFVNGLDPEVFAGLLGHHDTVIFQGSRATFNITLNVDHLHLTVVNQSNPTDTNTISGVEHLQFSDKTIFIENVDGANIARLYSAALGRAPDINGLDGWLDIYQSNVSASAKSNGVYASLAQAPTGYGPSIAFGFTQSIEFLSKYGSLNDAQFVTQLYQNVLGRAPEASGLNGWLDLMHDVNGFSREMVLVGFAESPENIAKTAADWLIQI